MSSRVLYSGAVRIGAFRSHPRDADFADSGPTRGHLLVFPRTCVSIQHAGRAPVVADPTVVMTYNRGQAYTRRAIAPIGDHCEWFAFPGEAILEARGDAAGDPERPFGAVVCLPSDARTYALAHLALRSLADPLRVEEACVTLLADVLARAAPAPAHAALAPTHAALVDATRRSLATRFAEPRSLAAIAGELGVSMFHLARVFRRATGRTIHGYRTELRIRAAIERLHDTDDLAALAYDLGFSSHSHFTAAFKKLVGVAPSHARASKNLTARLGAPPR